MEDGRFQVSKPIVKSQALSITNATFTCEVIEESIKDPNLVKSKKKFVK